jgi:hypothetical protein
MIYGVLVVVKKKGAISFQRSSDVFIGGTIWCLGFASKQCSGRIIDETKLVLGPQLLKMGFGYPKVHYINLSAFVCVWNFP